MQLVPGANDYVAYSGLSFTPAGPCPPVGESIVDDQAMRTAMRAALTASGAFNTNPAARLEQAGYIYKRADGTYDLRITPAGPQTNPCQSVPGGPSPQPGETLVAPFHVHPFAGGDILPAAACLLPAGAVYAYDNQTYGGGSKKDWEFVDPFNLPMYIIDKDEVFRLDGGTPPSQRGSNPNRWTWNNPACTW